MRRWLKQSSCKESFLESLKCNFFASKNKLKYTTNFSTDKLKDRLIFFYFNVKHVDVYFNKEISVVNAFSIETHTECINAFMPKVVSWTYFASS